MEAGLSFSRVTRTPLYDFTRASRCWTERNVLTVGNLVVGKTTGMVNGDPLMKEGE